MWRASLLTTPFGLTEPLFVPEYWNPPSLFDLAQRTGFDIESLIFCFGIGGIAVVLYNLLTGQRMADLSLHQRHSSRHRFHQLALWSPVLIFVPLKFMNWNPIYPGIIAMAGGALATMLCRPDLIRKTWMGGVIFVIYYSVFLISLDLAFPSYIRTYWTLDRLSGVVLAGIPLEEFLFSFAFGMYWSSVYEHIYWKGIRTGSPFPAKL
tara:strand:- start:1160 stop:1783 length:624 start_codon:yes stop_codon:yes gene_type:complete